MSHVELFDKGVAVIDVPYFSENIQSLRDEFEETIKSFPEFIRHVTLGEINRDETYIY